MASGRGRRRHRSGAVVLEIVLTLPIFAIVLMAIVEFGVLLNTLQYVEFASRSGSHVGARLNQADFYSGGGIPIFPAAIQTAVNTELSKVNIGGSPLAAAKIYLEHTVPQSGSGVGAMRQVCVGTSPLPCDGSDVNETSVTGSYRYVRVAVFVDATSATPNLLAAFGWDLTGRTFQQTSTFAYLQ